MLIRLVYVSTSTRPIVESELIHILEVARKRNSRQAVTGILLYSGGRFFQVLEGEEADVMDIYHDIAGNPKHRAPIILTQEEISERAFGDWSMAYRHVDSEVDKKSLDGYCEFLDRDMPREEFSKVANNIIDLIYQFRDTL
ncbi:MAG: BLUF domain-containing protein [Gammaproteobacteria bacterium]|nr:BLUF domain-containing protein [Gammaproteobacteria bacterium]